MIFGFQSTSRSRLTRPNRQRLSHAERSPHIECTVYDHAEAMLQQLLPAVAWCLSCTPRQNVNSDLALRFSLSTSRSHRHLLPHTEQGPVSDAVAGAVQESAAALMQPQWSTVPARHSSYATLLITQLGSGDGFTRIVSVHPRHRSLPHIERWMAGDRVAWGMQNSAAARLPGNLARARSQLLKLGPTDALSLALTCWCRRFL